MAERYAGREWKHWQGIWDSLGQDTQNQIRNIVEAKGGNQEDAKTILRQVADAGGDAETVKTTVNDAIERGDYTDKFAEMGIDDPTQYVSATDRQVKKEGDEYLDTIRGEWEDFYETEQTRRAGRLDKLAGLLQEQTNIAFEQNAPWIQENLSDKGLLHSSYLGEAFAKEKGRLSDIMNNQLQVQGLLDTDYISQLRTMGMQNIIGGYEKFKNREWELEDWQTQASLARELAQIQGDSMERAGKYQLIGDILGLGGAAYMGYKMGK